MANKVLEVLRGFAGWAARGGFRFLSATGPGVAERMGLAFMKEHQTHAYVEMLFADKLVSYLRDF